jgi:sporulation protein YlmC with PRC-barrel domain
VHHINDLISNTVLTEDGRNVSLVYDIKNALSVKSPKSSSFYLSNRDRYILSKKDTEMFKLYLRGIQNMKRRLEGKIPISKNLPVIYSRRYYL